MFISRKAGEAIFTDIMKILTIFFIIIYKHSRKVKVNTNYESKYNLYLYFLIQQNLMISTEKMLMLEKC